MTGKLPLLSPPSVLQEVGPCLYGPHFLTPLSLSLYCPSNHPHPSVNYDNLRAWVRGTRPIPSWVWGELHRLIQERKEEMERVEATVDNFRLGIDVATGTTRESQRDALSPGCGGSFCLGCALMEDLCAHRTQRSHERDTRKQE